MKEYIIVTEQKRNSPFQIFFIFLLFAGVIYLTIEVLIYVVNVLSLAEEINPSWQIMILGFLGFVILLLALMNIWDSFFRSLKENDDFRLKGIKPKEETRIIAEKLIEIREVKYPEESKQRRLKEKKIWENK